MTAEEKLTDIEREAVRKVGAAYVRRSAWTAGVGVACTGVAIWFAEWRLAGIAFLLFAVASCLLVVAHVLLDPKQEGQWARRIHTTQRAKKAREEQDRQKLRDLEREVFGAEG